MTTYAKTLMQNWIKTLSVTYSDELEALPASNLLNIDPAVPMQTSGTSLTITIDTSGVEQPFDIGLFIGNHNFTTDVSISIVYDGGAPVALDVSTFIDDTNKLSADELFNKIFLWPTSGGSVSANEVQIVIDDSTNPDGYLRIGMLQIGPVGGEENFIYGFEIRPRSNEELSELSVGGFTSQRGKMYDEVAFDFANVGMEMRARLEHWIREGGYERERWIALSPNDSEQCTLTFYGQITSFSGFAEELKTSTRGLYSCSITMLDMCPTPRNLTQNNYTDHASFVRQTERTDIFLGLLMPGELVTSWTLAAGSSYTATYPVNADESWQVAEVWEDGVKLTRQTTTGDVDSTAGSWYHDIETARTLRLHCSDDGDPATKTIEVRMIRAICNRVPPDKKWLIMNITWDSYTITNVCFEPRLSENGLSDIGTELPESAFYGVAVPNLSGIDVFNGKTQYDDAHGRYDKDIDRFILKQRYFALYHGDGGTILDFSEHLYIDKFGITTARCDDDVFAVQFEQSFQLQKMIPDDLFQNDQNIRLDWIPHFWGAPTKIKTFRQTLNDYGYAGHDIDDLNATYNGDEEISSGVTSNHDDTGSSVTITPAPAGDASITVSPVRRVNVSLVAGQSVQYAGAWLRSLMYEMGDIPLEELTTTSFQTFDDDYLVDCEAWIGDRQTLRQVLEAAAASLFIWIRKARGIWEIYRWNFSNLPASVATCYEDDILDVSKEITGEAIIRQSRVPYLFDHDKQQFRFAITNHPTAATLYPRTEILELAQGYLTTEDDALAISALYMTIKGGPQKEIKLKATGEVFRARPGDLITLNRTKGFDSTGAWSSAQFAVRSITLHPMAQPGFCDLVLAEIPSPISEQGSGADPGSGNVIFVRSASASAQSDGTVGDITEISVSLNNAEGYAVGVWMKFNMGAVSCLPDIVTFNGDDMTAIGADTSVVDVTNNRMAFYLLPAADAGEHTLYVHFPNVVDSVAICGVVLANATNIRDSSAVRLSAPSALSISASVTSAAGDLVMDGYTISAPHPAHQNDGSGQVLFLSKRISFNGTFISSDALTARGTYKDGGAGTTEMSHTEDADTAAKTMLVVSIQP